MEIDIGWSSHDYCLLYACLFQNIFCQIFFIITIQIGSLVWDIKWFMGGGTVILLDFFLCSQIENCFQLDALIWWEIIGCICWVFYILSILSSSYTCSFLYDEIDCLSWKNKFLSYKWRELGMHSTLTYHRLLSQASSLLFPCFLDLPAAFSFWLKRF